LSERRRSAAEEVVFRPVDNVRLANLTGPVDANLRQIETALDVSISRRGERFTIAGPREKAAQAAQALRRFYDAAARDLTVEDIQLGLVEISHPRKGKEEGASPALVLPRRSELTARTPRQAQYLQQMRASDITFCVGPAGTGKTYLAVAAAVDALERESVKRIVLTRPAVEAGEKLGFLPGDLAQKVDPYLRPLYDALYDLMGYEKVGRAFERAAIEIAPLAFMRGRTLNHSFIILDEAHRLRLQGGGDGRRHASGPRQGPGLGARRCAQRAGRRARHRDHGVPLRGCRAPPARAGHRRRVRPPREVEKVTLAVQRASRAAHVPSDATLRKWARATGIEGNVTVRYVGEAESRRLNHQFRGKDYATNVLSFPYASKPLEGDLVICAAVVAREAREQGKEVRAHHAHMLVHGLLHLAGLDHERATQAKRMESRERAVLTRLGFPDPYAPLL
jgi:phosphate starvation-inducible PhoH-like protein